MKVSPITACLIEIYDHHSNPVMIITIMIIILDVYKLCGSYIFLYTFQCTYCISSINSELPINGMFISTVPTSTVFSAMHLNFSTNISHCVSVATWPTKIQISQVCAGADLGFSERGG